MAALSTLTPSQTSSNALGSILGKALDPKIETMVETVRGEIGDFSVKLGDCRGQKALWSWKDKTILLDPQFLLDSEGNKVAYLIFELCNAAKTEQFQQAIKESKLVGELVQRIEAIEHRSALETKKIAIEILGEDSEFDLKYVYENFSLHYALQQVTGHAEWLAKSYFPNQRYDGTLAHPLKDLTPQARKYLYALLYTHLRKEGMQFSRLGKVDFNKLIDALDQRQAQPDCKKVLECAERLFSKTSNEAP